MEIKASDRIASITPYAFSEINKKVAALEANGVAAIDFGVGDPHDPPFASVEQATIEAMATWRTSGYPSYIGHPEFRREISVYMKRRFGVEVDPDTEVISSVGSKEMVFNFPEAFVNSGDTVIIPNPAYPPYIRGTLFAEGQPYFVNLLEENNFLPNLDSIPAAVWDAARMMWVCYPSNPTTAFATDEFYDKLLHYAHKHEVILCSDEAYIENYHEEKPRSLLEFSTDGVVGVYSFSKMANMTMYRAGWVAGDPRIIAILKKLKTNIDSGTPTFIQMGAIKALHDLEAQQALRTSYRVKADIMIEALTAKGFPVCRPAGTIYIWQKCPAGYDGMKLATRLLEPDLGIVATPGEMITGTVDGVNPGKNFIRLSLTPTVDEIREAAARIRKASF